MRITRQTLHKIAVDTVNSRVRQSRSITAAFLCGALADDTIDPVLGGTADIDLIFVHDFDPPQEREIVQLTPEVHLDIHHQVSAIYRQPRDLRFHFWHGPQINNGQILHDPHHLFDFAQASVRSNFDRPDTVLARVTPLLESARSIWFTYQLKADPPEFADIKQYLQAVSEAANGIACLTGSPLTTRRFLMDFRKRAVSLGHPGLYQGLLGLLGGASLSPAALAACLPSWKDAFNAAATVDIQVPDLHQHRYLYYRQAINAIMAADQPLDALWMVLDTWVKAVEHLPEDHPAWGEWSRVFTTLGLLESGFQERIAGLDAYLDLLEETLETWGHRRGVL